MGVGVGDSSATEFGMNPILSSKQCVYNTVALTVVLTDHSTKQIRWRLAQ